MSTSSSVGSDWKLIVTGKVESFSSVMNSFMDSFTLMLMLGACHSEDDEIRDVGEEDF